MAASSPERPAMNGHELLLALAGRLPDQALAQARRVLATDTARPAIALVAALLAAAPVPLTAGELAAIRALAQDADALPGVLPVAEPPALRCRFSGLDEAGQVRRDELDEAVVAAAQAHAAGVTGVWRAWRYGGPGPAGPYRVYIIQVEDAGLIEWLVAGLLAAVPDSAQAGIEVITLGAEPPPYQRAALAGSLLLWATATEPEFEIARAFDFADPAAGPGFLPGHHVLGDSAERDRLLAYLRGGHPVLTTTARMSDVLDPAAGSVVPASFRTDGEWIWTDAVGYYLSRHGLVPDERLLAHIQARLDNGHSVPGTDLETATRAADFLLHPPPAAARSAIWFPRGSHAGKVGPAAGADAPQNG
jgi:hypothetical protein